RGGGLRHEVRLRPSRGLPPRVGKRRNAGGRPDPPRVRGHSRAEAGDRLDAAATRTGHLPPGAEYLGQKRIPGVTFLTTPEQPPRRMAKDISDLPGSLE